LALIFRNGKPRLQRSIRRGGRVTSEYVASGPTAELIAEKDRRVRALRRLAASDEAEEHRRWDELDRALNALAADARGLAHAALTEAGFHQHKRQWRKRRGERS
jgi:hypothetical protein